MNRIKHFENQGMEKRVGIMVASHNEDTVRFAIEQMKQLDIKPEHKVYIYNILSQSVSSASSFSPGDLFWSAARHV